MLKILPIFLLLSTSATAGVTNREASVVATDTALRGIELCRKMLLDNGLSLHRAKWFKEHTRSSEEAMLAMIICDAYTRGHNDGALTILKEK